MAFKFNFYFKNNLIVKYKPLKYTKKSILKRSFS